MTDISQEFRELLAAAERISADTSDIVGEVLQAGIEQPLSHNEARALLGHVVDVMRKHAVLRQDQEVLTQLDTDIDEFIQRAEAVRATLRPPISPDTHRVQLVAHNGIHPRAVKPTPVFHERPIPVIEGYVRTHDIQLWGENARIDIHLNQFHQAHGRPPNPEELLEIMLGTMSLPGLTEDDQFAIHELAHSIAMNGVRKPPIIDQNGNLLDGNRRITACYYILNSSEFDVVQKRRAEWVQVWQLTEHATEDDREAVVVSLNFEPDHKQKWPEYVKARKCYEYWQTLLALEGRANPAPTRLREIRREVARKFALAVDEVARYIGMVELAEEFEDYHVIQGKKDPYAVKHKTEKYFQYFDELRKGRKDGVLASLNEDEGFKGLVYDLLYDDKFKNWNQIRELRSVSQNDDALTYFREAGEQRNLKEAQRLLDVGISLTKATREIERTVGANKRVELFTNWLENAPVRIFRPGFPDALTQENLDRLYNALKLVESYVAPNGTGIADAPR